MHLSSSQRDRERQKERERRQLTAAGGGVNGDPVPLESISTTTATSLFSAPIKQDRDDETTKQIKNTLGNFSHFAQCLKSNNSNEVVNPSLLGISTREMNRRKMEEIFIEMKNTISPISGLDDVDDLVPVNSHHLKLLMPPNRSKHHPPPPSTNTPYTRSTPESTDPLIAYLNQNSHKYSHHTVSDDDNHPLKSSNLSADVSKKSSKLSSKPSATSKLRLSHSSSNSSEEEEEEEASSDDSEEEEDSSSGSSDSESKKKSTSTAAAKASLVHTNSLECVENSAPEVDKWDLDNFLDIPEKPPTITANNNNVYKSDASAQKQQSTGSTGRQSRPETTRGGGNRKSQKNHHQQNGTYDHEMEEGELEDDDDELEGKAKNLTPAAAPVSRFGMMKKIPKKSRFESVAASRTPPAAAPLPPPPPVIPKSYSQLLEEGKRNTNNSRSSSMCRPLPLTTTTTNRKDTSANDENSWKDVKRRKEPSATSGNVTENRKQPKGDETDGNKKAKMSLLAVPVDGKRNKLTPERTSKVNSSQCDSLLDISNQKKGNKQPQVVPTSNDTDQLIVSIDLLKLNRVPCVERNGNVASKLGPAVELSPKPKVKSETQSEGSKRIKSSKGIEKKNSKQSLLVKSKKNQLKDSSEKSRTLENVDSANSPSLTVSIPVDSLKSTTTTTASPLPSDRSPMAPDLRNNIITSMTQSEALGIATKLKRNADRCENRFKQMSLYIEAVLYFIQTGLVMESKRSEGELDKAYQMYKETLNLIKCTTRKFGNFKFPHSQECVDLKLTIFSFRCQALLNCRLNRMKQRDIHENKELITQYISESTVNSVLSNHATLPNATVAIPANVLHAFNKQLALIQHSQTAVDLWTKAEQMIDSKNSCKDFFHLLDGDNGGPLLLSSSLEHLLNYTHKGIHLLPNKT